MAFDAITAALDIGGKLIDRLWPDPAQAAAAKLELVKMQQTGELATLAAETDLLKGQMTINANEAQSDSTLVSGWRPFLGWICGGGVGIQYIVSPFATWISISIAHGHLEPFPSLDMSTLMPLLFGILGLGAMRTYEKAQGVQNVPTGH